LRTLFYDFDAVTPGPKVTTIAELETALSDMIVSCIGEWRDKYEEILDKSYTYSDGRACERVYAELLRRFVR